MRAERSAERPRSMLAAEQGHIKGDRPPAFGGARINDIDQYEETPWRAPIIWNRPKRRSTSRPRAAGENQTRSSLSHYSSKDKGGKPSTKAALPQWSAAAADAGLDEEEPDSRRDQLRRYLEE